MSDHGKLINADSNDVLALDQIVSMKQNVPQSWSEIKLGDVCMIHHGFAFKSADFGEEGPIVLTPGNFTEDGELDFHTKRVVNLAGEYEKKWELRNGDLLVVMTDLSQQKKILGATVVLNSPFLILHNQRIGRIEFYNTSCLSAEFIRYMMMSRNFRNYVGDTSSGTMVQHTSPTKLLNGQLMLAPLAEQARIVSAIESLQERSSRTRALLAEVKPLIAQLRQSVLRSAFSGRLTADWRAKQNTSLVTNHTATEQAAASAGGAGAGSSSVGSTSTSSTGKNTVAAGTQTQQPEADTNGSPQSTDTKFETATELLQRIRIERRQKWETAQLAAFEVKGKPPTKGWQDKYKEPEPVDDSELPELPEGWCWEALEAMVPSESPIVYGIIQAGPHVVGGVPYIRPADIKNSTIVLEDLLRTTPDIAAKYHRAALKSGDLIFSVVGTIGKTLIVDERLDGANITQSSVRIRMFEPFNSSMILRALQSPLVTQQMERMQFGNAVQRLNVEHMRRLAIPVPPLLEWIRISEMVEASFMNLEKVENEVGSMQLVVNQLDQSILSKAFKGELVPQDPNDEPASELLARIRATREADLASKKSSKKKTASKKKKPSKKKATAKKKKTSSKNSDS